VNKITAKVKPPKMILKILLITGEERTHICDVPSEFKLALEFINNMLKNIVAATFRPAGAPFVVPSVPIAAYNTDWIVCIEQSFVAAKEFEEAIREAQERVRRELGFFKPKTS
jgi:hypothetical protein